MSADQSRVIRNRKTWFRIASFLFFLLHFTFLPTSSLHVNGNHCVLMTSSQFLSLLTDLSDKLKK